MASSDVEMASPQSFNCLLGDRSRNNNSNHVRTVQTVFEKNLKVFVRDHLENNNNCCSISPEDDNGKNRESLGCSSPKSSVSDRKQTQESQILPQISSHSLPSSPSGSDPEQFSDQGQPENPPRNEILGASSLVQIWEARLQQPSSGQSQAPSDNWSMSGLNQSENRNSCSGSVNDGFVNESEAIQPEDEDCGSQSERICVSEFGEKEREGVRVQDIIRKLSVESETINDNGSTGNNDGSGTSTKEVKTMEHRGFPQVACTPRIRGRQAYEDLMMQMVRERQEELTRLLDRNSVSKFTYRGRLQAVLKIRCLERCIAIQDSHRSKPASSDVNRSARGPGLTNLRDRFKTDSENSRVGEVNCKVEARSPSDSVSSRVNEVSHHPEASGSKVYLVKDAMPHKAAETIGLPLKEAVGKNVLKDTKSNSEERRGRNGALEVAKKAENSRIGNVDSSVEARSSSGSASSWVNEGDRHLEASRTKACLEDATPHIAAESSPLPLHEAAENNSLQETTDKSNSQEGRDGRCALEVTKKAVRSEIAENKTEEIRPQEKAGKSTAKEIAEEHNAMRIAEKVNLWSSKEKTNRRRTMEKTGPKNPEVKDKADRKASPQIVDKKAVVQEVERRIVNVETAERSIASRETAENITLRETAGSRRRRSTQTKLCNSVEIERTKKEHGNTAAAKSLEIGNRNNLQEVSLTTFLHKSLREASDEREEKEDRKQIARQRTLENKCVQDDKEVPSSRNSDDENGAKEEEDKKQESKEKGEKRESSTTTCFPVESTEFFNIWDESGTTEDDDPYNVESTCDWFSDISRPRSYWEDLRKQWYLEVLNTDSQKEDIRRLIERRTVSGFLTSDSREKIDRVMISRLQRRSVIESNQRQKERTEQWTTPCSASHQDNEERETEQEQDMTSQEESEYHEATTNECLGQSSAPSTMMTWSFRHQDVGEEQDPVSSPPSDRSLRSSFPTNHETSPEMQMICDLKTKMDQLQQEMLELRNSVKSCVDMQLHFQKSINRDSCPAADQQGDANSPLKRKCCVCYEMPVDSLLYRCGHMCTCLKCAHELQWNSRKCPICMAPILDVVRAFLDP